MASATPQKELNRSIPNPSRLSSFKFNRANIFRKSESKVALSSETDVAARNSDNFNARTPASSSSTSNNTLKNSEIPLSPPATNFKSRAFLRTSLSQRAQQGLSHPESISREETNLKQRSGGETSQPNLTSAWLDEQVASPTSSSFIGNSHFTNNTRDDNPIDDRKIAIPPIRSFRSSTARQSVDMNGRTPLYRYDGGSRDDDDEEEDRDRTLRALEGTGNRNQYSNNSSNGYRAQNEQRQAAESDDLFLNLARDDFVPGINKRHSATRSEKRKSRIALPSHRLSMPPVSYQRQNDGQNEEQSPQSARMAQPQPSYYSQRERPSPTAATSTPLGELNRSRYIGGIPRSSPVTPRGPSFTSSAFSPESVSPSATRRRPSIADSTRGSTVEGGRQVSGAETSRRSSVTEQARKPSITETSLSIPRNQYRQSNLSYSSRGYSSSPVVSKTMETNAEADIPRESTEETESTASTTAQSTIWDELDDIKQRMRRLEVIGKMPLTSGATISNSSNERPRTATTTVTTNSSSPKRGRGNSTVSVIDSLSIGEAHPNLRAALAKSKSLLNSDVYDALEKTANDALTISSMMGTAGQPGPISSAQSSVGAGFTSVTDRQVRKKADNMCRSLTELCIALNDRKTEEFSSTENRITTRPTTREGEIPAMPSVDVTSAMRNVSDVGSQALSRLKSSPRALSSLAERRNSLFASSSLPTSPRGPPTEAVTPTQITTASRRTSLMLRSRRAATEEPEDNDAREASFRAPSRALTELAPIGRTRNSPREYTSNRPLPEVREPPTQPTPSSLPLRRHFPSASLTSSPMTPMTPNAVSRLESRRYLERAANRPPPEQETVKSPEMQRDDDRPQRKSIGFAFDGRGIGRTSSITRRTTRAINGTD